MPGLSPQEQERRRARYFWDTRRTTEDPETGGYGWDDEQMFRDLERAETSLRSALQVVGAADLLYAAIDEAHRRGETFPLRVSTAGAAFQRERAALPMPEAKR